MRRWTIALIVATLILGVGAAVADDDNGFYVGAGFGRADHDGAENRATSHDKVTGKDDAWLAFVGYRFLEWLGVELGVTDLGTSLDDDGDVEEFEVEGETLSLVADVDISDNAALCFEVGWFDWEVEETVQRTGSLQGTSDGSEFYWGVGLQVSINDDWDLRAWWRHFSDVGQVEPATAKLDIDSLTIGALYRF